MKPWETSTIGCRLRWWRKSAAYGVECVFPVTPPRRRVGACSFAIEDRRHLSSWNGTGLCDGIAQQLSITALLNDDDDDVVDCQNTAEMKMTVTGFCWLRHIHLLGSAVSQHSGGEAFLTWLGYYCGGVYTSRCAGQIGVWKRDLVEKVVMVELTVS